MSPANPSYVRPSNVKAERPASIDEAALTETVRLRTHAPCVSQARHLEDLVRARVARNDAATSRQPFA